MNKPMIKADQYFYKVVNKSNKQITVSIRTFTQLVKIAEKFDDSGKLRYSDIDQHDKYQLIKDICEKHGLTITRIAKPAVRFS